jgi:hypothetical protein
VQPGLAVACMFDDETPPSTPRIPSWRTAISWLVPAEPCSVIAGSGGRADRFLTKRLGFARMIRWSGLCSQSDKPSEGGTGHGDEIDAHVARLSRSDKPGAYYRRGGREGNPPDERRRVIEMNIHTRMLPAFGMTMAALTLAAAAPAAWADASSDDITCDRPRGPTIALGQAKLFFEHNSTNADTGVHGAFDTSSFAELCVYNPKGRQILAVEPRGKLLKLTMGGIFFESREPPSAEVSIESLKQIFPRDSIRSGAFRTMERD